MKNSRKLFLLLLAGLMAALAITGCNNSNEVTIYKTGDTWGFVDIDGNVAIEAKYNVVHHFSEGFASVGIGEEEDEILYGFIDKN